MYKLEFTGIRNYKHVRILESACVRKMTQNENSEISLSSKAYLVITNLIQALMHANFKNNT